MSNQEITKELRNNKMTELISVILFSLAFALASKHFIILLIVFVAALVATIVLNCRMFKIDNEKNIFLFLISVYAKMMCMISILFNIEHYPGRDILTLISVISVLIGIILSEKAKRHKDVLVYLFYELAVICFWRLF